MAERKRIERCLAGDKTAYREFYDLYSKAMYNVCLRMVNDAAEAEDILQEAFVAAFQQINRIASDAQFGGYLKKIVINRSIDLIRKRKIDFRSLDDAHYLPGETETETAYDIPALMSCFAQLPDGFRVVLTLFLFENYSHKEIAEMLNITEGTSKSQYKRAREKLAALYHKKMATHA